MRNRSRHLTNHPIKLLLLMVLSCLWITACTNSAVQKVPTALQSKSANCRVIQHAIGQVCVPINPQRVVVLDSNPLDAVLALGVKPVGAPEFDQLLLPEKQTKGIESIGISQPSLEKIALLKPDLILANKWDAAIYSQLSQIAPTVIAASIDSKWKEDLRLYAQALNKAKEAEQLLQNYQNQIQDFQHQMGDKLNQTETSIIATINYGSGLPARIYLGNSFMGSVIEEVGLPRPHAQATLPPSLTDDNWAMDVSTERLDLLDGDVIFAVNTSPQNSELKTTLSALQQHPLWLRLNAVKTGRVYSVNYYTWVAQRNIGGANRILDDLFKTLVGTHPNKF